MYAAFKYLWSLLSIRSFPTYIVLEQYIAAVNISIPHSAVFWPLFALFLRFWLACWAELSWIELGSICFVYCATVPTVRVRYKQSDPDQATSPDQISESVSGWKQNSIPLISSGNWTGCAAPTRTYDFVQCVYIVIISYCWAGYTLFHKT